MSRIARAYSLPTYIGLAALAGASICISQLPLGPWRIPLILLLTAIQGLLMLLNFMRVRLGGHLIWIAVGASFVWLGILFALALGDYLSRPVVW
jgi:caa(3)-type oxidase subunit IV